MRKYIADVRVNHENIVVLLFGESKTDATDRIKKLIPAANSARVSLLLDKDMQRIKVMNEYYKIAEGL